MDEPIYDIFITHGWRYHDDWLKLGELFDQSLGDKWRNFSLPWYDPALDPNTEIGKRLVHRSLEQQIVPATGVILLSSVYESKSARKWVTFEIELARKYRKRIVGIPAFGAEAVVPEAIELVDAVCGWDVKEILAALNAETLSGAAAP